MEKLTYDQRLAVLRYVFKRELKYLGVRMPVQLIPSGRLLAGTLACYCPATGLVEINKWLLMQDRPNGAELCAICAHEAQHVKQMEELIKDVFCVMLQRYNYLRIQCRLDRLAEKERLRIERKAVNCSKANPYKNREDLQKDLLFVQTIQKRFRERECVFIGEEEIYALKRLGQLL